MKTTQFMINNGCCIAATIDCPTKSLILWVAQLKLRGRYQVTREGIARNTPCLGRCWRYMLCDVHCYYVVFYRFYGVWMTLVFIWGEGFWFTPNPLQGNDLRLEITAVEVITTFVLQEE
jgi:hypothetical protein